MIGGNIVHPKTWNRYGYCWGNPLILVDLDGRNPLWSAPNQGEITEAVIKDMLEDANRAFVEGFGDVKASIAEGISDLVEGATAFYEEHEEAVEVGAALTIGAVIFTSVSLTTAAVTILESGAVGGILGAAANGMKGGSLTNGFVGDSVGNYITESLNDRDITDPGKPKKDKINILLTSAGMGFTQVGLEQIGVLSGMKKGAGLAEG